MNTPRKLGLAAAVVFAISHALTAYGDASGFTCFRFTASFIFDADGKFLSGSWFYYSGFALSNVLFLMLAVALFVTKKYRKARTLTSAVLFLHVLSWLIMNAAGSPPTLHEVKVGYYVWLVAYGLLVAAYLCKEPTEKGELASVVSPAN